MVSYPNAKINLGLRVLRRRPDGFHDIESVMYPVAGLCDTLEVARRCESTVSREAWFADFGKKVVNGNPGCRISDDLTFSQSMVPEGLLPEDNLCVKAFRLFQSVNPVQDNFHVHLIKGIPSGAGLGGGSADAAGVLLMMNELSGRKLSTERLCDMAASLGSDCPFFTINEPMLAKGRGDVLSPVQVDLSGMYLMVLDPGIHIDTGKAYSSITASDDGLNMPSEMIKRPVSEWKDSLVNDFEPVVMAQYPEIRELKEALYGEGAVYASMSGSGSALFGIFSSEPDPGKMVKDVMIHGSMIV